MQNRRGNSICSSCKQVQVLDPDAMSIMCNAYDEAIAVRGGVKSPRHPIRELVASGIAVIFSAQSLPGVIRLHKISSVVWLGGAVQSRRPSFPWGLKV
jgi:hypothetical protein